MAADEMPLTGGGSTAVHRRGGVVLRERRPWSPAVLLLLTHLDEHGFRSAPRPVASGFAPDGREQLEFIGGAGTVLLVG